MKCNNSKNSKTAKKNTDNEVPTKEYYFVYGKNPVKELIKFSPERIKKLHAASQKHLEEVQGNQRIVSVNRTVIASNNQLDRLANTTAHQGIVAEVDGRRLLTLDDLIRHLSPKDTFIVVAADSIYDPQNVGSILRACECFKVDAFIYSANRGAGITGSAIKASVGASEIVNLTEVSNLNNSLNKLRDKTMAYLITADSNEGAFSLETFEYPKKVILVLGSEGSGIQKVIRDKADMSVKIAMYGVIDSLNVSQAASVFFYEFRKQNSLGS